MTRNEKEKLIHRYIAAYNDFDIDGMVSLLHPEVSFKNISNGEVNAETKGINKFRKQAIESASLFSSRHQEVTKTETMGTFVAVGIAYEGVLAVDIPNVAKSGETLSLSGKSEFEFHNGKITKITDIS